MPIQPGYRESGFIYVGGDPMQQQNWVAAPDVAKPGLPEPKQEYQGMSYGSELPIPSNNFATDGLRQMGDGAAQMTRAGADAKFGGASKMFRGAAQIGSPVAAGLLPFAATTAPAMTAGGLLGSIAGSQTAKYGAQAMGAGDGVQDFSEDVGGLLGGGAGVAGAGKAVTAIKPYAQSRAVQDATVDMVPFFGRKANRLRRAVATVTDEQAKMTPPPAPVPSTGPRGTFDIRAVPKTEPIKQPTGLFSWTNGTAGEPSPLAPTTPVQAAAQTSLLDDIARGQAGKPFVKLDPAGQATVRAIAEKIAPAPAAAPTGLLADPPAPTSAPQVANRGLLAPDFKTKAADRGINEMFHGGAEESGLLHGTNVTNKNRNLVEFAKTQGLPKVAFLEDEYNALVDAFNKSGVKDPVTGKPLKYLKAGASSGPKQHGRSVPVTLQHFNDEYLR